MWQEACAKEPRLITPPIDIRSGTLGVKKDWQKRLEDENAAAS